MAGAVMGGAAALTMSGTHEAKAQSIETPNIISLMADDLGHGYLGGE